ncbi:MAG: uroporphyrinogen-III C-methyltransferase [Siphonobacter sp.]
MSNKTTSGIVLPKLTVVGAGPGDPELITLKAIKALQKAAVVLYDALIDPVLLEHCSFQTEKIYVGKRPGQSHSQDMINYLIVDKAFSVGHVVRLKGGDPFVFGRGQEEIEYARQYGIETSYIPGISSALAVPGHAGIPMTARGTSESFWVITGTKTDGSLSKDLCLALCSTATIVILMGMNKLDEIADLCHKMGKAELPAAILQNGTTADERTAIGVAHELPRLALEHKLRNPAVIVLGDVVRYGYHTHTADWQDLLKNGDLFS